MKIKAYCDGASRIHSGSHAACAFAIYREGELIFSDAHFLGQKTNNYAEYSGLLHLLQYAANHGLIGMNIYSDSQLVVNQVNGTWAVKHELLKPMHATATYLKNTGTHHLYWVRGHNGDPGNELVDSLCNKALDAHKETQ